jgi:hypothetical protein
VAIQLDRARAKLTSLMSDACSIVYDADGNDSDTLDPTTLHLTPAAPGTTVYSGACRISPMGTGRSTGLESQLGDLDVVLTTYKVAIPFDAAEVAHNAVVTITASADPELVGVPMRVLGAEHTTLLVQRTLICQVIG